MTDQYVVIGNPIAQSKSPQIHASFAEQTGQDLVYGKLQAPPGGFEAAARAFRAAGGRGMNVTAPFKREAVLFATQCAASVQRAGAANALKFEGDEVLAENFDGLGLLQDVLHNLRVPLRGKRVLLMGAGGAARGALLPLLAQAPAALVIANRTISRAHELAALGAADGPTQASSYAELEGQTFDVVFNATSASLRGELAPVPESALRGCVLAYEAAYGMGLTPFLRLAQGAGVNRLADGVGMLVEQAAHAFAWWRGVRPNTRDMICALAVPLV